MGDFFVLVTCEHGGNRIPPRYRRLFSKHRRLLATHRGYDRGALSLAEALSRAFGAPLVAATTSRQLVDLNRSPHHPRVFGAPVRAALSPSEREAILQAHYHPHRRTVEEAVREHLARRSRPVLHLGVHSFTPVLDGTIRTADVGLLYDPSRRNERNLCRELAASLRSADAGLRVRRNYPYLGASDGLTTALRRRFSETSYLGIEIEMNQRFATAAGVRRVGAALVRAVTALGIRARPEARLVRLESVTG